MAQPLGSRLPDELAGWVRDARFLVTGGAGFIGSQLAEALLAAGASVRVLDNFFSGKQENLESIRRSTQRDVELVTGDVRDADTVRAAVEGVDFVLHQAALPSVPRSVADPEASHGVNATGTLLVLQASRKSKVKRVVVASSSSVYGETPTLPKHEQLPLSPLSPYAVSKLAAESYAQVFHTVYGAETVALRYFNVFGPRQDPASEYAAVVPRFVSAAVSGSPLRIFGAGDQTRDFTYVDDVVQANVRACVAPTAAGKSYNIAGGVRVTIKELAETIVSLCGGEAKIEFQAPRKGDIKHSLASIERAAADLGYVRTVALREGLERTVEWFRHPG